MISWQPFWDMMKRRGITTYGLEYTYLLNPAEISRLKHNHNFTLSTLDRYCALFNCSVSDLIIYIPSGHTLNNGLTPDEL